MSICRYTKIVTFCWLLFFVLTVPNALADEPVALNRLFSPPVSYHMYTTNCEEISKAAEKDSFRHEGTEGYVQTAQTDGTVPLYRLWNGIFHMLLSDPAQIENAKNHPTRPFVVEGVVGYVLPPGTKREGTAPLHRWISQRNENQFYTISDQNPGFYHLPAAGDAFVVGVVWTSGKKCAGPITQPDLPSFCACRRAVPGGEDVNYERGLSCKKNSECEASCPRVPGGRYWTGYCYGKQ